ncbi:hypothetical protein BLNAU_13380 [Blattamonas nauphoetae]|uniref:Uncharacterized protein n=1 Tax=Blattamonas nauphoetae TaxID=2049346 RepID=A0ABQ9XN11_9EUKA|nr:hypothetical protein BLNAU_13380 [Blattamonas nauphoetae]
MNKPIPDLNEQLLELRTTMCNMATQTAEQLGRMDSRQLQFDSVLRRLDKQGRFLILHQSRFQRWSKTGADAIEIFDEDFFIKTGNTFRFRQRPENEKTNFIPKTLFSPLISSDVAQLSFTISSPYFGSRYGAISTHLVDTGTQADLRNEKHGRACWGLNYKPPDDIRTNGAPTSRYISEFVLEADCRVGKRTLKLSEDGRVYSTFYVNLSLPFRFAINLRHPSVSVTIHSLSFTAKPTLKRGEKELKFPK